LVCSRLLFRVRDYSYSILLLGFEIIVQGSRLHARTLASFQQADDTSDEHKAHLQWRLEEIRVIKAGSLDRLVEALSSGTGEVDSTYVNVFLATYRSFASPKQVLNLLLER
jgi:hypothetical protein